MDAGITRPAPSCAPSLSSVPTQSHETAQGSPLGICSVLGLISHRQEQTPAAIHNPHPASTAHCHSQKAFPNPNHKVAATVEKPKDSATTDPHFLQHFRPRVGMEVFWGTACVSLLPAVGRSTTGDHEMLFVAGTNRTKEVNMVSCEI